MPDAFSAATALVGYRPVASCSTASGAITSSIAVCNAASATSSAVEVIPDGGNAAPSRGGRVMGSLGVAG
jgi:hypothetical protein